MPVRSTMILAGALVLLVLLAVILGPAACNRMRSQAAQNRLNQSQGEALANSAADAVKTQGEANRREAESEAMTRSNEEEIRNAEGANDPANPAVDAAGRRALCLRNAYRHRPECRMFQPTPNGVEKGR